MRHYLGELQNPFTSRGLDPMLFSSPTTQRTQKERTREGRPWRRSPRTAADDSSVDDSGEPPAMVDQQATRTRCSSSEDRQQARMASMNAHQQQQVDGTASRRGAATPGRFQPQRPAATAVRTRLGGGTREQRAWRSS
ncbi:hypothetical protein Syun_030703 [Stephania yunnanensis]|uniref:Uncharacterized protein n=1 Tax=Stephania yunnanensis TaxID=152371 RepID=A0AAP0E1I0_9MAGN